MKMNGSIILGLEYFIKDICYRLFLYNKVDNKKNKFF